MKLYEIKLIIVMEDKVDYDEIIKKQILDDIPTLCGDINEIVTRTYSEIVKIKNVKYKDQPILNSKRNKFIYGKRIISENFANKLMLKWGIKAEKIIEEYIGKKNETF